jgi:3',5'-cyclic AMP phosphodiesterase CpdA
VAVDTTVPGHVEGHLDRDMLRWLDAQLTAHVARPTILAMHHPPVLSGIRPLDDIGLPGSDRIALARLIARHPHVELITAGHVHRTMVTTFAGRPALICPSTDIQLELDFRPTTTGYHLVHEPPAFAVHVLIDGRIATHVQPVGEFAPMA